MTAKAPPDPRVADDPLVKRVWALVRELGGHHGGDDEETEEAPRTGASEGKAA